MIRSLALLAGLLTAVTPAIAGDLIKKSSPHSVATTLDRLEAAIGKAGATVFARIDHAGGAKKVGMKLNDAQLLIFGNPKLGTPAMQAGITAGLDLPLRVLAYTGADGTTHLVYHAPATMAKTHGIPTDAPVVAKMTGALDKLTGVAVAAE
ncbi:MAG: DUF302 domain-containing protein [Pseudomonadota bacterium]